MFIHINNNKHCLTLLINFHKDSPINDATAPLLASQMTDPSWLLYVNKSSGILGNNNDQIEPPLNDRFPLVSICKHACWKLSFSVVLLLRLNGRPSATVYKVHHTATTTLHTSLRHPHWTVFSYFLFFCIGTCLQRWCPATYAFFFLIKACIISLKKGQKKIT